MQTAIITNTNQALTAAQTIVDKWFAFLSVKQNSQKTYLRALKRFFEFLGATGKAWNTCERADLALYLNDLQTLKPTTRALYLQAVKLFYKFANAEGYTPNNIAAHLKVKGVKHTDFKKDNLTNTQTASLLSACGADINGVRNKAFIALMATAGLRVCEIANARLGDLENTNGAWILRILGKGRSDKTEFVKIAPQVLGLLNAYLKRRGALSADAPLFACHGKRNNNQALTTRTISFIVKETMRKAGFDSPRLTAHSLRHTAAVLMMLGGANLDDVKQVLRHTDSKTTQIYTHRVERIKNNSEARAADLIFCGV